MTTFDADLSGRKVSINITMVPHATFGHVAKISVFGLPDVYATPLVNVMISESRVTRILVDEDFDIAAPPRLHPAVGRDEEI